MFEKWLITIIVSLFCGTPIWLYLLTRQLLDPHGFFAEFLLLGLGVWALGALQIFLFFIWLVILMRIWTKKPYRR